jgi:hypothetical protein
MEFAVRRLTERPMASMVETFSVYPKEWMKNMLMTMVKGMEMATMIVVLILCRNSNSTTAVSATPCQMSPKVLS